MNRIALILLLTLIAVSVNPEQTYNDQDLSAVMAKDKAGRQSDGSLITLPLSEHMYRADVYMSNRQFASAREHWQIVLTSYTASPSASKALFGMGRSNMWERKYELAIKWFERLIREYPSTFDGQEGLAYKGACHVRLGQNLKAVAAYEKYTLMFPHGKRIESSYLNILDAYREAGEYELANQWVDKTQNGSGF